MYVHAACTHTWRSEVSVDVLLKLFLPSFWGQDLSVTWSILLGPDWLMTIELQGFSCLPLPSPAITAPTTVPSFLYECWGSNSGLHACTQYAISPSLPALLLSLWHTRCMLGTSCTLPSHTLPGRRRIQGRPELL